MENQQVCLYSQESNLKVKQQARAGSPLISIQNLVQEQVGLADKLLSHTISSKTANHVSNQQANAHSDIMSDLSKELNQKIFEALQRYPTQNQEQYLSIFKHAQGFIRKMLTKGISVFEAEQMVIQAIQESIKPILQEPIKELKCQILDRDQKQPDLAEELKKKGIQTKEKLVDRIHEVCIRAKQNHPQFKNDLQPLLQSQGGFHFKSGFKLQKTKAYLRFLTKILKPYTDLKLGSKQVYTDLNHWYWAPVYKFFNRLMDAHTKDIKIELYDLLRCKCYFKTIQQIEKAFAKLQKKYKIFSVKNRINQGTRDILLNFQFEDSVAQVQLSLECDTKKFDFAQKLYKMSCQPIGPAFCCFALGVDSIFDGVAEINAKPVIQTKLGTVKTTFLRQKLEPGFERLSIEDAKQIEDDLINFLIEQWTILSLTTGTIRGFGHGDLYQPEIYGPQAGEMVIIKRHI